MLLTLLLYALASFPVVYLLYWLVTPLVESRYHTHALSYAHQYVDPRNAGRLGVFPSIFAKAECYVSFIIPCYNEEARLRVATDELLRYATERSRRSADFTWEVIFVDDGSRDRTAEIGLSYSNTYGTDRVRVLSLQQNQGKGGAVQQGMLHARGQYLLMVDADGATDVRDFEKLERRLHEIERDGVGIVVGSRAHLADEAAAKRKWYRNILMHGFHALVSLLCVRGIRDTQCGFKLFTRAAARAVFVNQRLRRWSFDVELLFIARTLNMCVSEVSVTWTEIAGSKLDVLTASLMMARDLVLIRGAYATRFWTVQQPGDIALPANNPHASASVVSADDGRGASNDGRR